MEKKKKESLGLGLPSATSLRGPVFTGNLLPGLRPHLCYLHIAPLFLGLPLTRDHISCGNREAVENLRAWAVKSIAWVQTVVPSLISWIILGQLTSSNLTFLAYKKG